MSVFVGLLVPIGFAMMKKLDAIEQRLDDFNGRVVALETWRGDGRRYTGEDAERDFGVLSNVLEKQGLVLEDHEMRIRSLERVK